MLSQQGITMRNKFIFILLFPLCCFGQTNNDIKGYWRLNGNSNDVSGNSYNGTDANITYSLMNGKWIQGAGFNGTSSKITFPNTALPTQDMTLSFWYRHNGAFNATNADEFISKQTFLTLPRYGFELDGDPPDLIGCQWRDASGTSQGVAYFTDARTIDGNWHNVVMTVKYSTKVVRLYFDGAYTGATVTLSSSPVYTTNVITVGRSEDTFWGWYDGQMDEIIIAKSTWSDAEVSRMYNKQLGIE